VAAQPFPVGAAVYHLSQEWARSLPGGTARVVEVKGPYYDDSWEYLVACCRNFSRRPAPDNPMDQETWWSSRATLAAKEEEK
jgi:hypothetical protein